MQKLAHESVNPSRFASPSSVTGTPWILAKVDLFLYNSYPFRFLEPFRHPVNDILEECAQGSQSLLSSVVAAEMRAIELDALHGGIGCGLGGA
jgi:hypothetical protein